LVLPGQHQQRTGIPSRVTARPITICGRSPRWSLECPKRRKPSSPSRSKKVGVVSKTNCLGRLGLRGGDHDGDVGCCLLKAPAQPFAQQPLHRLTAKLHAGHPLDDHRGPGRGPHVAVEAVSLGALQECPFDRRQLAVGNRGMAAGATAAQRCLATPSWRATAAVGTPWANSSAARSRTACRLARSLAPSPCWRGRRRAPPRRHVDAASGVIVSRSGMPAGRPGRLGWGCD
jgi:hypothetical protein